MLTFEKSVGAVVFRRFPEGIRFLLLDHGNSYWSFAKGHVEKNETEKETLVREVREETGIADLQIQKNFREISRYFYRAGDTERKKRKKQGRDINIIKSVIYYLAETDSSNITLSFEHQNYGWFTFPEALEKLNHKASRRILEKADAVIKKEAEL